jgi:GAF domain-containing protein
MISSIPPLTRIFTTLFAVGDLYTDPLDRQRAAALLPMCLIFGVLGLGGTLGLMLIFPTAVSQHLIVLDIIMAAVYIGLYFLVRQGGLRLASYGFILMALMVPTLLSALHGVVASEMLMLGFAVPIVSAALLLSPTWAFATAAAAIVCVGIISVTEYLQASSTLTYLSTSAIVTAFLLGVLALFAWLSTNSLYRWAENALRSARQLEAAAVISETASAAPDVGALLNTVVERIREAFGFYHAQVFMVESDLRAARLGKRRGMARLEASTGRAGEALLARGHALPIGSRSVIGLCTYRGEAVVVNDVRNNPMHRPNELLPDTRAELALPLLIGGEVIGALDVQSTVYNAFQPEDIRSLQLMANQLATAIEKARLVGELQVRADENQRLFEEAQRSLREIEELNRRLIREGWYDYLHARRVRGTLGYTLHDVGIRRDTSWTAPMRQAYQGERTVVIRHDQQTHIAAVPLQVRGEVIGVLEIERGGDRPWTDDEIELIEVLVDRLSLAVENARLFEQATLVAEREQFVSRVGQEVQAAETIEEVLQTALSELSTVLGASRGIVQISPKAEDEHDDGSESEA